MGALAVLGLDPLEGQPSVNLVAGIKTAVRDYESVAEGDGLGR